MPAKKRYFLFATALVITVILSGCATFGSSSVADKSYELGEYARAAEIYKKTYSKEKNKYFKGEIAFKMGECYRKINRPSRAASAYSKSLRTSFENPMTEVYMAQCLLKTGKIAEAQEIFTKYLVEHPKEQMAHNGLKSCELILEPEKPSRYEIIDIKEFKSKYSDYSPSFGGTENDIVYFSSMRHSGKRKGISPIDGQGNSNIYSTRPNTKGKWMVPEALDETINTQFDEGATALTADGTQMYFTRCRYDKTKAMGGEIYVMKRAGGQWSEPALVPLGGDSLLFAHPAISPDNLTLYFVSDIEGSNGGKDIWKVVRKSEGSEWSEPMNLGEEINTNGDEMFPTVKPDGTLMFSSDGHPGYGGLDLFTTWFTIDEETGDSIIHIKNMGRPINSSSDDFGMVYKAGQNYGMLTSSRNNTKGYDKIYQFKYRPVIYSLKGSIVNDKTHEPLTNAYVKLVGSDGTYEKPEILPNGTFKTDLKPNTDYVFLVASMGYLNQKVNFSTNGLEDDKVFDFEIGMISKSRPVVLEDISYDAGGYEISNQIAAALDKLFDVLTDNPQVRIEIGSHTDTEGDDTQNIILSQKRAEAILNYLLRKGITPERLSAKGYGETQPVVVDSNLAKQYRFLNKGDVLTKEYIAKLSGKNKEIANKLNRRTEFKVTSE